MNSEQIKRVLNLVKKTNKKVVVFDSDLDDFYVISKLEEDTHSLQDMHRNERLTEDDLLAKINRDIAEANITENNEFPWWKEKEDWRDNQNLLESSFAETDDKEEDEYYLEPVE